MLLLQTHAKISTKETSICIVSTFSCGFTLGRVVFCQGFLVQTNQTNPVNSIEKFDLKGYLDKIVYF